ncbi:NUDIX domain-containing protein, partial [Klebsiella pneumoniae]|nr:NUDIX domain-containing protein [Klebsiella pneumoniae]
ESEIVHPGKWAIPGGKLEWEDMDINNPSGKNDSVIYFQDMLEKLLHREVAEEAGIEIHDDLRYLKSIAFVRPDGVPVMFVSFA